MMVISVIARLSSKAYYCNFDAFSGPNVTFLGEPYEVLEESDTLEICFNVTQNSYQGDLTYAFVGLSAEGKLSSS